MAIPNTGELKLRGTIGAEWGYTSTKAQLNKKFGPKIGKGAGVTTRMGDFRGASSLEFIGSGSVGLGSVESGISWSAYNSGAREGDLVVVWGFSTYQLGSHGMVLPSDGSIDYRFFYAASQGSATNANRIGYYFIHDNTSNGGRWYSNAVYSGLYGRVHYAIFRGPKSAASVSTNATRHPDHMGWVGINYTTGNYYSESAPSSIPQLSGFSDSDNYYTGNIAGRASNGYTYDHMYSYRMRTQYRIDGAIDLPVGVTANAFIELRS